MDLLETFAVKLTEHDAQIKRLDIKCDAHAYGQKLILSLLVHTNPKLVPELSNSINEILDHLDNMGSGGSSDIEADFYIFLRAYLTQALQFLKAPPDEGHHLRLVKPKDPLPED